MAQLTEFFQKSSVVQESGPNFFALPLSGKLCFDLDLFHKVSLKMSSGHMDNILKDLDDLDYDDNDDEENERGGLNADLDDLDELDDDGDNDNDGDEEDDDENEGDKTGSIDIVKIVKAKLASSIGLFRGSQKYKAQMATVQNALESKTNRSTAETLSSLQADDEYNLILDCNRFIHAIDEELSETHRFVSETYAKKFPELESLIPSKVDYVKSVLRIGNETDMTLVDLNDLLPSATVMVVSVTGSTTAGKQLSESDLALVVRGCEEVLQLQQDKNFLLAFVESRMTSLAPNICALIGARLAALLVGLAGGVVALSKIPACNIEVMGQEKRHLAGFSNASALPHTGILYQCELVQRCPPFLRRKLLKQVASKVALLARVDSYARGDDKRSVLQGERFRTEVEEKIEKLLEPDKARTKKALPVPEEKKRSKRGGKRVRKMKERYAMTEMRAQHNKISFDPGAGEYGDSAMGLDRGMLGQRESGHVRAAVRKEVSLVKKQKKESGARAGASSATNGLASSLAFTPVQGIELVNPSAAAARLKEANSKWFGSYSGFMSAAPK